MPLPIPDILERAGKVLKLAKEFTETDEDFYGEIKGELREALKKVNEADLLAVLNEVGKVYVGMHNIQVLKIGSRAVPEAKILEFAIEINFGLGPRTLIVPVPLEAATNMVKNFNDNLVSAATGTAVKPSGLILDAGQAGGKP